MTTCWYCSSEVPETSQYCPSCGHSQSDHTSSPLFGVVDPTTGIWNSKFVNALVGQEANRAVRYHRPLSVLVVELDHAEHIHRELEQIQIEGLLRELAERLGQAVRDTDTVGFLDADGPPHFAIVLPETDEPGAGRRGGGRASRGGADPHRPQPARAGGGDRPDHRRPADVAPSSRG